MDLRKAARDPWVIGQVIWILAVLVGTHPLARALPATPMPLFAHDAGGLLLVLGLLVAGVGAHTLGPSLTPGIEPLPGGRFVAHGIYRQIRHPVYTGVILGLTGYALAPGNWLVGAGVFLVSYLYFRAKAAAEERWLVQRYPEYEAYRERTPMLFTMHWRREGGSG